MSRLKETMKINELTYSLFRPKPWHLFRENFQKMNFKKRIRFILQSLRGSFIYYALRNGEVVGYIVFGPGKGFRYPFTKEKDLIISPYVVKESCRGQGIGTRILVDTGKLVPGRRIYAVVMNSNIASIKAMEKAWYKTISYADHKGIQRKYELCTGGEFIIFFK